MKTLSLAISIALSLACTTALAADPPKPAAEPAHSMHAMGAVPPMDHANMGMAVRTPAEQQQMFDAMFAAMDANKDGSVSKAEFTAHHLTMMAMHQGGMMGHDAGCAGMLMGSGGMRPGHGVDHGAMASDNVPEAHYQMELKMFNGFDKNHDGSVTRAEFPAQHPMLLHFDLLDANKDGRVSQAEFASHHGR